MNKERNDMQRRAPRRVVVLVTALVSMAVLSAPAPASADVEWDARIDQAPTHLHPGSDGVLRIAPMNVGDTASAAAPTVQFTLPEGVSYSVISNFIWSCDGTGTVTCSSPFADFLPVSPNSWVAFGTGWEPLRIALTLAPETPEGVHPLNLTVSSPEDTTAVGGVLTVDDEDLGAGPAPGSFALEAHDATGAEFTQAGGHPYDVTTTFTLNTREDDDANGTPGAIYPVRPLRDVVVDLPPGLVGDANATPKCPHVGMVTQQTCPHSTQVGVASVSPSVQGFGRVSMFGVYNVEPDANQPAKFVMLTPLGTVTMVPTLRSDGDMGLSVTVESLTELEPVFETTVTFWGVPAAESHDVQRCAQPNLIAQACSGADEVGIEYSPDSAYLATPHAAGIPPKPFLTLPTACEGDPLISRLHVSNWIDGALFEPDGDPNLAAGGWATAEDPMPPMTGCERLTFEPAITVTPTETTADSPTGIDVNVVVPQNGNPTGLATAHVKDMALTLPEGFSVNPSSAGGLAACNPEQIGLLSKAPLRFSKSEPACPDASKIGYVEVQTPLLDEPMTGDVYVAKQNDNPFNSLLAMYVVAHGPGLLVKLGLHVTPDPHTGRLVTTVINAPQLPFDSFRVHINGGERAPLATPQSCGPKTVSASLTSWAGQSATPSDTVTIDCPGTSAFAPTFSAGTVGREAGSYSSFVMNIDRPDRHQYLRGLRLKMPKGLIAKVQGVTLCRSTQAAVGACPSASRIGTATTGAGAGSAPYFLDGPVYLTQGYKGAPYGLVVVVRAVAGPFDLGTVVVRQALHVDRRTAAVTVVSDPLPTILEGIPLRLRAVRVNVDRSGFMRTPTSCANKRISATLSSIQGATHSASSSFQVDGCEKLGFKPRLGLRLTGRNQTTTGKHPGVRAILKQGKGQAGIKRVEVRLPEALALDPDNARALCEFDDGTKPDLEKHCPTGSIVGRASAVTPLLNRRLRGNVYFVKNVRTDRKTGAKIRTLPMLVVALRGEIALNLRGKASVKGDHLVSTFSGVPDAPVSRFNLNLKGGGTGILVVTDSVAGPLTICDRQTAQVNTRGHNGKRYDRTIRLKTPCKGGRRK